MKKKTSRGTLYTHKLNQRRKRNAKKKKFELEVIFLLDIRKWNLFLCYEYIHTCFISHQNWYDTSNLSVLKLGRFNLEA